MPASPEIFELVVAQLAFQAVLGGRPSLEVFFLGCLAVVPELERAWRPFEEPSLNFPQPRSKNFSSVSCDRAAMISAWKHPRRSSQRVLDSAPLVDVGKQWRGGAEARVHHVLVLGNLWVLGLFDLASAAARSFLGFQSWTRYLWVEERLWKTGQRVRPGDSAGGGALKTGWRRGFEFPPVGR